MSGLPILKGILPLLVINVVVASPLNALLVALFEAGPLGEELGWRGYVLPRLLEKFDDFSSSLILGLIWAFWHLPIFVFSDWRNGLSIASFSLLYPVTIIALSFAMTKLWRWTQGSVLTAILFHGVFNFTLATLIDPRRFDLNSRSNLGLYLTVISAFLATALLFWLLNRWLFTAKHANEAAIHSD